MFILFYDRIILIIINEIIVYVNRDNTPVTCEEFDDELVTPELERRIICFVDKKFNELEVIKYTFFIRFLGIFTIIIYVVLRIKNFQIYKKYSMCFLFEKIFHNFLFNLLFSLKFSNILYNK